MSTPESEELLLNDLLNTGWSVPDCVIGNSADSESRIYCIFIVEPGHGILAMRYYDDLRQCLELFSHQTSPVMLNHRSILRCFTVDWSMGA